MTAKSFFIAGGTLDGLPRALAEIKDHVRSPSGGIVFTSGPLSLSPNEVAQAVAAAWKGVPACVVPAAGVLTEKNEVEGAGAISGMLWSGGKVAPFAAGCTPGEREAEILKRAPAVALFSRPEAFQTSLIETLGLSPNATIFGAGTVGRTPVGITAGGELLSGEMGGLAIAGLSSPIVDVSTACRLLTPFLPIDEVAQGLVLRLGGRAALDVLSGLSGQVGGESGAPLVFAALSDETDAAGRERYVVRPIRGIDPTRRGVMVGQEARLGTRLAFAVRDAAAGKELLEASARNVVEQTTGASARFLLYFTCAGRGQGLYGSQGVESRILRKRFGDLPIAGMHSSFELIGRPLAANAPRVAMYSAVLAMFRSPS
ncbi:MAG: FIST C-terminal domain-containing protein [Polyangiaceae bacterium]|nr:FIST C-terminal domain-containing protein [Polyangiaceae bacterium]